jgi:hypothetical protein
MSTKYFNSSHGWTSKEIDFAKSTIQWLWNECGFQVFDEWLKYIYSNKWLKFYLYLRL